MEIETPNTADSLEEGVRLLKEWISKEPHLPKIQDDDWLRMCLHNNKGRLEKTKTKIDNYFSYRNKYPDVLKNRDPSGSDITRIRSAHDLSFADRLTKDGGRLIFSNFHSDPSLFDINDFLKMSYMLTDILSFDRHSYTELIVDCKNVKYLHIVRGFAGMKKGVDIYLNMYSEKFKGFHVINLPTEFEIFVDRAKTLLPKNIFERVFIHSYSEELCKMVDEDIVCKEFGGKGPCLSVYNEYTTKLFLERSEWFLAQDNICTNERMRRKTGHLEEMKGSFTKLDID